jgi:diguanylate cyclase (GGDEF)-like protein
MALRPLSINHYTLAFLLLITLMFSGTAWLGFRSIENAGISLEEHRQQAGQEELRQALKGFIEYLDGLPRQLSDWDELFQQIDQPLYYSYWRQHRLLAAGKLPALVEQAELYDASGNVLGAFVNSPFPPRIDPSGHQPEVRTGNGHAWLYHYIPLRRSPDHPPRGWLGLRIDLIPALRQRFDFRDLDESSLQLKTDGEIRIPLQDLPEQLGYRLKPNPGATELLEIVRRSVWQLAALIGLLSLLFYILMVQVLGRPLRNISRYIDQLHNRGDSEVEQPSSLLPVAELEKVRASLIAYDADLRKAQQDLGRKNRALWKLAHHDALTGMLNRRAFDRDWNDARQLLRRRRIEIGLVLFDVNRFKAINDTYGHQTGDEVLKAISHSIQSTLRQGEQLYRIGGDEFASILIGTRPDDMLRLTRRCLDAIENHDFEALGLKETVRVSCGIAYCPANDHQRLDKLQWQADVAVYQAKKPGRHGPVMFEDGMADGSQSIFSSWINEAVYQAVTTGEGVVLYYQSIVNTRSLDIDYYESLLRIRHESGFIPPSHIFPVVHSRQLETALDRSVIRELAQDLIDHKFQGINGVSINLSAETLVQPELIEWLAPLRPFLDEYRITLEVTETSLITHLGTASKHLETLREQGFKVALDDFGSGYSSLLYLTRMPVDTIKFDIALIQGMEDERIHQLVRELARMLAGLGYELVAEGIETKEVFDRVIAAGFTHAQGYYLDTPKRHHGNLPSS